MVSRGGIGGWQFMVDCSGASSDDDLGGFEIELAKGRMRREVSLEPTEHRARRGLYPNKSVHITACVSLIEKAMVS
eukprot:jgi/Bigna1/140437/aug1.56_g15145